ncbi:MAG: iron-containing alcohol dehydrogenase, partial [Candidatus Omnitrophota bacterium]
TAAGVADIMAHVFEYYLSPVPYTETQDALSEALLKTCIRFGGVVCEKGDDYDARANILWASTLALSGLIGRGKISDWTCHAIEHEVSAIYDISHGAGLAVLLPSFMEVVAEKYGSEKLVDYGANVWGIERNKGDKVIAAEAIARTRDFFKSLGLPSKLSEMNISDDHFEIMTKNVLQARAVVEDFDQLSERDIRRILQAAL